MSETLFPAPTGIAHLYDGKVMHARLKPVGHRFTYRVASILVDLDQLTRIGTLSWLVSHNRFNLFSVHDRDLGSKDATPPRAWIDRLLAEAGVAVDGGRVMVLTYPRVLGYVFNPISVYWCYAATGDLKAIVYEVSNTFGDRHSYVAPVKPDELGPEGLKQARDKIFYVSPFLDMSMRYHFRLRPPGATVAVRILETDADGPILAATFNGARKPLTTGNLLRTFMRLPFLTIKIMAGIHYEAAKLWLKGIRFHSRPEPPEVASFGEPPGRAVGS
jgi:uncharacterized protein